MEQIANARKSRWFPAHSHHIAGAYLLRYAREQSWREDNRRVSNGDQVNRVAALALKRGKSVDSPDTGSAIAPPGPSSGKGTNFGTRFPMKGGGHYTHHSPDRGFCL